MSKYKNVLKKVIRGLQFDELNRKIKINMKYFQLIVFCGQYIFLKINKGVNFIFYLYINYIWGENQKNDVYKIWFICIFD